MYKEIDPPRSNVQHICGHHHISGNTTDNERRCLGLDYAINVKSRAGAGIPRTTYLWRVEASINNQQQNVCFNYSEDHWYAGTTWIERRDVAIAEIANNQPNSPPVAVSCP